MGRAVSLAAALVCPLIPAASARLCNAELAEQSLGRPVGPVEQVAAKLTSVAAAAAAAGAQFNPPPPEAGPSKASRGRSKVAGERPRKLARRSIVIQRAPALSDAN